MEAIGHRTEAMTALEEFLGQGEDSILEHELSRLRKAA